LLAQFEEDSDEDESLFDGQAVASDKATNDRTDGKLDENNNMQVGKRCGVLCFFPG
jgi:hypothetical protein